MKRSKIYSIVSLSLAVVAAGLTAFSPAASAVFALGAGVFGYLAGRR